MRSKDDPTVLPDPPCSACRKKPWTKWCRPCNLVFCDDCIDRKAHACKPDEVRGGGNAVVEPTAAASIEPVIQPGGGAGVAVQMPIQTELFVTPTEPPPSTNNGTAQ